MGALVYQCSVGDDINNTIKEMIKIAQNIDCEVMTEFNGISVKVNKFSSENQVVTKYYELLKLPAYNKKP